MNPSDVIDERYRLERLLGTGGMSEVWLAEDNRLGRWVAVKILRDSLANREDDLVDTLVQEARIVAKLQHANIVGVYDYGVHKGHHFLVMEYVHGYSVRQLLQTQSRLTEGEAIRYGAQVATALHYAHQQNVIHCDVKPENILVNEEGTAKIADFGVAEAVTRTLASEQMRDVLGTFAYLAPEVIQGAATDPRSDIYSLALTIYEMVSGRLPFSGNSAAALAGQRLGTPAPPLRTFAMDASPELEAVLARALATSPADRYATAAAFATALRNVPQTRRETAAAPVVAPPGRPPTSPSRHTTRVRRGAPPPPRRRSGSGWNSTGVAALVGAGLIALGVAVAAAIVLSQDDDNGGTDETPTPAPATATTTTATPSREPTRPAATATAQATPTTPATPTAEATAARTPTTGPATATPTRPPATQPPPSQTAPPAATATP